MIGEKLRPDARATVEFFRAQGVELKVMSGDRPETVAAIAREAGIAVDGDALDGRDLDSAQALAASVIGRITPEGKRSVVERVARAGPLRRDGRRRRQRRPRAESLAAGDRAGQRHADGAQRRRPRPRRRRLRRGTADGRGGAQAPAQPRAGRQAVRDEVGVRDVPDPVDRTHGHPLPAAPAPPHPRRGGDDRHPGLLPRARSELGRVRDQGIAVLRRPFRRSGRDRGRPGRSLQLPVRTRRRRTGRSSSPARSRRRRSSSSACT